MATHLSHGVAGGLAAVPRGARHALRLPGLDPARAVSGEPLSPGRDAGRAPLGLLALAVTLPLGLRLQLLARRLADVAGADAEDADLASLAVGELQSRGQ